MCTLFMKIKPPTDMYFNLFPCIYNSKANKKGNCTTEYHDEKVIKESPASRRVWANMYREGG